MAMICPSCTSLLTSFEVGGVHLDICAGGCGGIWFDQGELRRLDEPHEVVDDWLWQIETNALLNIDFERRRRCPRCIETLMLRHYWSIQKRVLIDVCQTCAGYWLDDGELRTIRSLYKTEAERKQAAMEHFTHLMAEPLAAERQRSEAENEKLKAVARMFRHITPSYYFNKKD